MPRKILFYTLLAVIASMLLIYFSLGLGGAHWQYPWKIDSLILSIRWPRIMACFLVGACLSASGAALQALFDNPLADPSLIGTSGGAALAVIISLSFGIQGINLPIIAFLGATAVCFIILCLKKIIGGSTFTLLILGFIISAFCSALVSLILFTSNDLVLRSAILWLSGSLAESGIVSPIYACFSFLLGMSILCLQANKLDLLMLGDNTAKTMGVSLQGVQFTTIIATSLLTSTAVALAGIIGFIGMIIPNLITQIRGGSRKIIIILSAWVGGLFLLLVDSSTRSIAYPLDVPTGIIIALIGAPCFLLLFLKNR